MDRSRTRVSAFGVCVLSVALAGKVGSEARADAPDAGAEGVLSVRLLALRNDNGQSRCGLWSSEKGFPKDRAAALRTTSCPIAKGESSCTFDHLLAGTYAVACFHDENNNGVLDTGLFGIPVEGVVASNSAKGFMGPPRFKEARFSFAGVLAELRLKVGY